MRRDMPDVERTDYKVFLFRRIFYVPHYRNPNAYVAPGYPRYTKETYTRQELIHAGAQELTMSLFPRTQTPMENWNV